MSVITGNGATYPTSFEGPDDGDDRDAGSINAALEALADRTEYMRQRVFSGEPGLVRVYNLEVDNTAYIGGALDVNGNFTIGGGGIATIPTIGGNTEVSGTLTAGTVVSNGNVTASSGQVTGSQMLSVNGFFVPERTVTIAVDGPVEAEAIWEKVRIGANDVRWTTNANTEAFLRICLNQYVPNKASITSVVARYEGGPGHTDLPENMPRIVLFRKRIGTSGAASGIVGSAVDPSLDHNAFQTEHDIPLELDPSVTLDTDTGSYYVLVWSESGANALLEAIFSGLLVTYTYTRVDRPST